MHSYVNIFLVLRPVPVYSLVNSRSRSLYVIARPSVCLSVRDRPTGTPSVWGLNRRGVAKYSDLGPFQGYILETVQDRR